MQYTYEHILKDLIYIGCSTVVYFVHDGFEVLTGYVEGERVSVFFGCVEGNPFIDIEKNKWANTEFDTEKIYRRGENGVVTNSIWEVVYTK